MATWKKARDTGVRYETREEARVARNVYQRAWQSANREKMREANRRHIAKDPVSYKAKVKARLELREAMSPGHKRAIWLKGKYGIALEEYTRMFVKQGGVCAICRRPELKVHKSGTRHSLNVDHCHITGRVRGLLCSPCNTSLGKMGDDPSRLREAAMYLESEEYAP